MTQTKTPKLKSAQNLIDLAKEKEQTVMYLRIRQQNEQLKADWAELNQYIVKNGPISHQPSGPQVDIDAFMKSFRDMFLDQCVGHEIVTEQIEQPGRHENTF